MSQTYPTIIPRLKPSFSLRSRLLLLVLLATIPGFCLIGYSAWEDMTTAEMDAQQKTRQIATFVAEEQNRIIGQSRQLLAVLSKLPIIRSLYEHMHKHENRLHIGA